MAKGPSKARRIAGVERLSGAGSWSELIGDERMRVCAPSIFKSTPKVPRSSWSWYSPCLTCGTAMRPWISTAMPVRLRCRLPVALDLFLRLNHTVRLCATFDAIWRTPARVTLMPSAEIRDDRFPTPMPISS